MKTAVFAFALLVFVCDLAFGREALRFSCQTPEPAKAHKGRSVEASIVGKLEDLGFERVLLSYAVEYAVDCQAKPVDCWSAGKAEAAGLANKASYVSDSSTQRLLFPLQVAPSQAGRRGERLDFLLTPSVLQTKTSIFEASLRLAHIKGSFGADITVQCKGTPVESFASDKNETLDEELARARKIIAEDFALPELELRISRRGLGEQLKGKPSKISFSAALQSALVAIFEDTASSETPMQVTLTTLPRGEGRWNLSDERKRAAQEALKDYLNAGDARISVFTGSEAPELAAAPEDGESADDNWIFFLNIPALSDHLYWAIVDKKGEKAPYVYGFN